MDADKDGKSENHTGGAKPAAKTVVGVPTIAEVHADRPLSDMERTRQLLPKSLEVDDQASTAIDAKPISQADAERLLERTGLSGTHTGPPSAGSAASRTPWVAGANLKSSPPSVATSSSSRPSALGIPRAATPGPLRDHPSVVPGVAAIAPKAATQPPPSGGEGTARAAQSIPARPVQLGDTPVSMEELSGSLLLPDASGETPAAVEELSGSVLIEDPPDGKGALAVSTLAGQVTPAPARASFKPPVPRSISPGATPPSVTGAQSEEPGTEGEPPVAPMSGDIELHRLPRGGLEPMFDGVRDAFQRVSPRVSGWTPGQGGRPKWFFPVVAAGGLVVGIGLVGLIATLVRGTGDSSRGAQSRPSSKPTAQHSSSAPSTGAIIAPPPSTASAAACTVSGEPRVLAPGATVGAGVEIARAGDDLAIGFAATDRDAIAIRLDAVALSAIATVKARSRDILRRVTPLARPTGPLGVVMDTDAKGDRLQGRRTVLAEPVVQLGMSDAHLAWTARAGGAPAGALWALDEGGNVESLRGAAESAGLQTLAVAFRRGGEVLTGAATGSTTLSAQGSLAHIAGLGTAVGSPAIALSGGTVLVAWADRPSSDEPWRLRWTHFNAGGTPSTPETFLPPAGGKGEQAMSPSLSALPGGRFLFVWTEGPASGHDVRALTLESDGTPVGLPLAVSSPDVNAGQGQAAVTASGHGAVVFLESGGNGFEVAATPITCAQ